MLVRTLAIFALSMIAYMAFAYTFVWVTQYRWVMFEEYIIHFSAIAFLSLFLGGIDYERNRKNMR